MGAMRLPKTQRLALLLCALGLPIQLAGCATGVADQAQKVSARVEAATGAAPAWSAGKDAQAQARARVATTLAEPLTPQAASAVALANHPRVAAAFAGLGVAQADYLAAVLPGPISLGYTRLTGEHSDEGAALHEKAALDLLGLLTLPARLRAGAAEREVMRAQTTADVLSLGANARRAMIQYIAVRQDADLMAQAADAADAAADAADELFKAGNIAKIERDRERLFAEEVALANLAAQAALVPARERVNIALGLDPAQVGAWRAIARLPAPPEAAIVPADAEAKANAASLDLEMAAGALKAARSRSGFAWLTGLLPGLALEGEREREDGEWKRGGGLEGNVAVFDLGGGERLRMSSQARQRAALLAATKHEIAAQARMRAAEAEAAREIAVRRRSVVLPLSSAVFEGAQKDFNAMEISLLQLIEARRQRLETGRAAVSAVRDYWLAQTELDLIVAGVGGGEAAAPAASAAPQKAKDPGH